MRLEIKKTSSLTLLQTPALQQSLLVLQLPVAELSEWLSQKIEQNPLLDYAEERGQPSAPETKRELNFEQSRFEVLDDLDASFGQAVFDLEEPPEDQIAYHPSLSDHLMRQAREIFDDATDLRKAEEIIGSLDERGFLGSGSFDEAILKQIQSFDPPGIAAQDLRESLLLQLDKRGKKETESYRIVNERFDEFLQGRIRGKEAEEILCCDFSPGRRFCQPAAPTLVPDVMVRKITGGDWIVEINETILPRFLLKKPRMEAFAKDDKPFIRSHLSEGKWILRSLRRRKETLEKIVRLALAKNPEFFNGGKKLLPFSVQEAAQALHLHESTIARAINGKILAYPGGMTALRSLFSSAAKSTSGQTISRTTVVQLLRSLIEQEDKTSPLSDEALALALKQKGITCARRTVAKYRLAFNAPPAHLRKSR